MLNGPGGHSALCYGKDMHLSARTRHFIDLILTVKTLCRALFVHALHTHHLRWPSPLSSCISGLSGRARSYRTNDRKDMPLPGEPPRRDLQFRPLLHGSPLILPSPATQTFLTNTNYFSSLIEITFFRGRLIGKRESARESVAPPSPPPPPFTAHLKDNPTIVYGDTRDTLVDVVRGREDSKTKQQSLHETGRENKSQIESARTLAALDRDLHFMVRMCHHRPRHRRVGVFPYALWA